jgi:hypothetical protein
MKSTVDMSAGSLALTLVVICAFLGATALAYPSMWCLAPTAILVAILVVGLCRMPMRIEADEQRVCIFSSLSWRNIAMADIVEAERYTPAKGTLRLCASDGFMGYWGRFRDNVIGTYTGYFGRREHCFRLRLTGGRQYVLGCRDVDAMVEYIREHISKNR